MAAHEYYTCDHCGAKLPCKQRLDIVVDRRMDAAGDVDNVWEPVDLCWKCLAVAFSRLLADMDYDRRKAVLKELRLRKE